MARTSDSALHLEVTSRIWLLWPLIRKVSFITFGLFLIHSKQSVAGSLEVDDWEGFDRYSPRIHKIDFLFSSLAHGATSYDIDPYIYRTLHKFRPNILLFPSLQTLILPKNLPEIANSELLALPLIMPSLCKLGFIASHRSSVQYLNRLLGHSQPQLQHIQLSGRSAFALAKTIIQFNSLEYLDMGFHNAQDYDDVQPNFSPFLNELSTLKNLSSLLISVPSSLYSMAPSATGFLKLKRLAMTGSVAAFTIICRGAPWVEHLVLESSQPQSYTVWESFFKGLPRSCPRVTGITMYGEFILQRPIVVAKLINPLYKLPLRGFRMQSEKRISVCLSDVDIKMIVEAWPDLVALEIFRDGRYVSPGIPTMLGVKTALTTCKNLQYLVMNCWNQRVELASTITLDNTYPPFVTFN